MADIKVTTARARVALVVMEPVKVTTARARVALVIGDVVKVTTARARVAVVIPNPGDNRLGSLMPGEDMPFY
jgi:hypothetical protein